MGCCCMQMGAIEDIDENLAESKIFLNHNTQALQLKQKGNDYFKKKAYENAIKCYNQALTRNPNQLVYYTNLALAYKANSQYQLAIQTIDRMIRNRFTATLNYAELMKKGKITKARCLNSLAKRYIIDNDYTAQKSQNMINKIEEAIQILQQFKTGDSTLSTDQYLNNSLKIKMYLAKIMKKTSQVQVVHYLKKKMGQSKNGLHGDKNWQKIKDYFADQNSLLKQIQSYYSQCHRKFIEQAQQDEQYLIDPITYVKFAHQSQQKYKQPVIVPSGITYQQDILRQYFQKGQYKDPITKQKFQVGQKVIVRNNSIKNYIYQMGKINEIRKQDIQLLVC